MAAKAWAVALVAVVAGVAYGAARAHERGAQEGHPGTYEEWQNRPDEPFTDGEATFQKVLGMLRAQYVNPDMSDDEFYKAATQGLLEHLAPNQSAWNKLLTPTEYAELTADMKGEVVGVGVEISFESVSGMGLVLSALPGTPAEAAGLKHGDRILEVDGRSFAGLQLRDMVYAFRGKVGTDVTLTMLRDAKVFPVKLTRTRLAWDEVDVSMLDDGVGLLGLHNFNFNTPKKARDGLTQLKQQGAKALIVDLRGCSGGSFDAAVKTTEALLPDGATVVRVRRRGGDEEVMKAAGEPVLADLPVTVLIDGQTASGCELMAGSLKQNLGATLVGEKTFGKWSMQTVDELPNHYAAKYTIAGFYPPDGTDLSGKGLTPDVPVAAEPGMVTRLQHAPLAERLQKDAQLQAAKNLMRLGQ